MTHGHARVSTADGRDDRTWTADATRARRAAEFESDLIRARTGEGRKRAKGARRPYGPPREAHYASMARRNEGAYRRHGVASRSCPSFQCKPEHHIEVDAMTY